MLNKETILLKTHNGLDVFKHFIPGNWRLGKNFLNPFYKDKKASCNVFLDKHSGLYKIKDFGDDRFNGDCFALVGSLYNLECRYSKEFVEIMKIIDKELHLNLDDDQEYIIPERRPIIESPKPLVQLASGKQKEVIKIDKKAFSDEELKFWGQYAIDTTTLDYYEVSSIATFTALNKEGFPYTIKSTQEEPVFGYFHNGFIKIYRPFSQLRFQFLGQKPELYIFGLEQVPPKGDILFITGGEKDVMTLHAHRFNAISFNSETANIPVEIIRKLSYRFKHLVLLYDMDATGYEASSKHLDELKEFDVKRLLLPLNGTKDNKDISDYFREGNTRDQFKTLFLDLLENIYAETFAMLKSCEIDFKNPPVTPEPLITINNVTIGSPGNILCITGSEGSGKSNFMGSIVAGAMRINGETVDSLGTEVVVNETGKSILYYDTEQSEDQLYRNLTYILKRCNREQPPKWFKAYCLINMSRRERLNVISQSMDKFHHQFNGIHMVVIDGIGDLIMGLNDEVDSVKLIEEIHRLAGIYKTCILVVLHLLPSGLKLRGHLGSELQRKAAGILSIEKDALTDISTVKALKVRSGSPLDVPLIQFGWDKDQRKLDDLMSFAEEIFTVKPAYSYTELVILIQEDMDVKERTAKSYIKFMKERGILERSNNSTGLYKLTSKE
jgi:hypothetical protein